MEEIRKELMTLMADLGGTITPKDVLAYARQHPKSATFRWLNRKKAFDEKHAAECFALLICRQLIQTVKVTLLTKDKQPLVVRAFVSLGTDRKGEGGYRSTEEVLSSQNLLAELIETCLREVKTLQNKYKHITDLAPLWEAAQRVQERRVGKSKQMA